MVRRGWISFRAQCSPCNAWLACHILRTNRHPEGSPLLCNVAQAPTLTTPHQRGQPVKISELSSSSNFIPDTMRSTIMKNKRTLFRVFKTVIPLSVCLWVAVSPQGLLLLPKAKASSFSKPLCFFVIWSICLCQCVYMQWEKTKSLPVCGWIWTF